MFVLLLLQDPEYSDQMQLALDVPVTIRLAVLLYLVSTVVRLVEVAICKEFVRRISVFVVLSGGQFSLVFRRRC